MPYKKTVIIVAGGAGTRMKNNLPKQFIKIKGKPVIAYSIGNFLNYDKDLSVIVVSHKDYSEELNLILSEYFPGHLFETTVGGETRFESVKKGLNKITDNNGVVAIHDAARPLASITTIKNCFEAAAQKGNAVPVIDVNESLRLVENEKNRSLNRNHFKIVQTPQCFRIDLIKKAFEQNYNQSFTDDATVLEHIGVKINLVEGNTENIKITTPLDLILAEALLK
jgi:2-C-methyl-D-erythritol 4-phosphate cytidylyltransferase